MSTPANYLFLMNDLERAGFGFRVDGDILKVSPSREGATLTPEQTAMIRQHKADIIAFVREQPTPAQEREMVRKIMAWPERR